MQRAHVERDAMRQILDEILDTTEDVNETKLRAAKRFGLTRIPSNSDLLSKARTEEYLEAASKLQLKRVRSASGINVISVMCRPAPCPHGHCAYCPEESGVPNSYTGREPAAMRGVQNRFDPWLQVVQRLDQLKAIGHPVNKVELIIQGGTFPAQSLPYQEFFVKRCLDALIGVDSANLEEAKRNAERSQIRNVGLTIETRPDWAKERHADQMLSLGATRVEVGVQTLDDKIYRVVERGHTVNDVIESFRALRDSAFKIVAHMMPGLPGATVEKDLEVFRRLFEDEDFRPDMMKIYPCLVVRGTKIYDWWREGRYSPYTTEEAVELLSRVKELVPRWVRIMRIQREIPVDAIAAGVDKSNLRELVLRRMGERGKACKCIRCREVGHRILKQGIRPRPGNVEIRRETYQAGGGVEEFISAEDPSTDSLMGYVRMRVPSEKAHRREITERKTSLIRELHVYGPAVPVGQRWEEAVQHKGWGTALLKEAEEIAVGEYGSDKMVIISALGTKEYYEKFGYARDGPYVSKPLH